jgi:hypothetical protein
MYQLYYIFLACPNFAKRKCVAHMQQIKKAPKYLGALVANLIEEKGMNLVFI